MSGRLAFYFDSNTCSGCKTCQVACKDKNDLPMGVLWRRVYELEGGDWKKEGETWIPEVFSYHLSMACNHCEDPVCLRACPTGAITKNERGIVSIDPGTCMGCHYCEWVCPYGAPQFNEETGRMTKCDFCADYLEEGKDPACVAACPMRALDFGEVEELKERHPDHENIMPLPDPEICLPAFVVNPHHDHGKTDHSRAEVSNWEEVKNTREQP